MAVNAVFGLIVVDSGANVNLREKDTVDVEAADGNEVEAEAVEVVSVPPWYILAEDAPRPSAKAGTEPTCFVVGFAVETLLGWLAVVSASAATSVRTEVVCVVTEVENGDIN